MNHLKDNVRILAPVDRVFTLVADASRTPEWLPSMIEVSNIKGHGKGSTYDWVFKFAGVPMKGQSTVTRYSENQIIEIRTGGMVDSTWTYLFTDDDEHTRLHVEVQYAVPKNIASRIAEELLHRVHQRELETALANLKDLAEHAVGARAVA